MLANSRHRFESTHRHSLLPKVEQRQAPDIVPWPLWFISSVLFLALNSAPGAKLQAADPNSGKRILAAELAVLGGGVFGIGNRLGICPEVKMFLADRSFVRATLGLFLSI